MGPDQWMSGVDSYHHFLLMIKITRVLDKRDQRETALVLAWGSGKPDGKRGEGGGSPCHGLLSRLASLCPHGMASHHEKPVVEGASKG